MGNILFACKKVVVLRPAIDRHAYGDVLEVAVRGDKAVTFYFNFRSIVAFNFLNMKTLFCIFFVK